VHYEWLIFAERSFEVQPETIQPDEVRRNPTGHLIEAGWTWQRADAASRRGLTQAFERPLWGSLTVDFGSMTASPRAGRMAAPKRGGRLFCASCA
jgi:hypothetical protein